MEIKNMIHEQVPTTLILLPCHGAFKADTAIDPQNPSLVLSDEKWDLWGFQKNETASYLAHVKKTIELTAQNPDNLAVISGSERPNSGEWTEALTYYALAEANSLLTKNGRPLNVVCEESAHDSLMNVLGGLCKFKDLTGNFPKKIIVVGWKFKERRFLETHMRALHIPADCVEYVGVNDPPDTDGVEKGETYALSLWDADPYGMKFDGKLMQKRLERGKGKKIRDMILPYTMPQYGLDDFLTHIADPNKNSEIYPGVLPWEQVMAPNYTPLPLAIAA
jgi:hypothetical protein